MLLALLRDEERWGPCWLVRESEGGSGDDGREGREGSIAAACCCCRRAAASSGPTAATGSVCDIGETEAEWGGGGGEKGLAGMLGVLVMESGGCGGRCWGDTKGLAGVTKGMTVAAVDGGGPTPGAPKHIVAALVASAGTRTHRHREAVFLLDGHGGKRPVERARPGVRRSGGGSLGTLSARSALARGGHAGVQGRQLVHHPLVLLGLVCVDGLCMLAEVVEAGKLLAAVAGERSLARVFPGQKAVRQRTSMRRGG